MIRDVTLWHDPGIKILNSLESRIVTSGIARVFPFVTCRILGQTWKDQRKLWSLLILEGLISKKLGSATATSQILSGSCARTYNEHGRKFSAFLTGSWVEKMYMLARSWRSNLYRIRQGNERHPWQNPCSLSGYDPDRCPPWILIGSVIILSEEDLELFEKNPGKDPDWSG